MRILILTCATGGGHLRAAAALEKYIRETTTHEVIQMDFLKSIGKLLDKLPLYGKEDPVSLRPPLQNDK